MPPKRKRKSKASARKAPKPSDDWRRNLFFWRGAIDGKMWSGKHEVSFDEDDDGIPSDAEFDASTETFKLECTKAIASLVVPDATGQSDASFTGSSRFWCAGGDLLPSADNMEISVVEGPPLGGGLGESAWANVAARGTVAEFGEFVALGLLERVPGLGSGWTRLTLARRFIADDDPRRSMSAAALLARIDGNEEGPDMWACEQPWLALPYKVPATWPAGLPVHPKAWEGVEDDYAHYD
jgi:hypothetical protein